MSILYVYTYTYIALFPPDAAAATIVNEKTTLQNKPTITHKSTSLVSLHKPARADVRGNLGPASVVTTEKIEEWLTDRWQGTVNRNCD